MAVKDVKELDQMIQSLKAGIAKGLTEAMK